MTVGVTSRRAFLLLLGVAATRALGWGAGVHPLAALAEAYLKQTPDEAPALAQARLLAATRGSLHADAVRAAVRADFARGDVVEIAGFVLSRSECRYCVVVTR